MKREFEHEKRRERVNLVHFVRESIENNVSCW